MFKKIVCAVTAVTFLTSGASIALAQDTPKDTEDRMHARILEQDKDGDGVISKVEFLSGAEKHFNELDANGDGVVSLDEFKSHREDMKTKMKEKMGEWREKRQERRQNKADDTAEE